MICGVKGPSAIVGKAGKLITTPVREECTKQRKKGKASLDLKSLLRFDEEIVRNKFHQIAGFRDKWLPTLVGILFSLFLAAILFFHSGPLSDWIEFIDNKAYDFQVRRIYKPLSNHPEVVIVGLDDKSLKTEGRLPWDRKKMGNLISHLKDLGAKVVALDFLFPTPQENIAATVFQEVEKTGNSIGHEEIVQSFDSDAFFAKSLAQVDSILGFALTWDEESLGMLPAPLLRLDSETQSIYVPEKNSYLGNIPLLQKAAKNGGFINNTPDLDNVTRFAPLVYRLGSEVFGSFALVATMDYLGIKEVQLDAKPYRNGKFLEAIQVNSRSIPVDPLGRILIPYRGPAYSFPHLSATDVLHAKISPDAVRGKLVFIGVTTTGSGDLVSSPISQSLDGVEVHASIAQGIIDQYLPYKPGWEKGVSVALILIIGLSLSFLLSRMGPFSMVLIAISAGFLLLFFDYWMWSQKRIVLSLFFPLLTIGFLFLFNLIDGFIREAKRKKMIKDVFGQYVSFDYIESLLKKGVGIEMSGENKELSVLFADIRGFTSFAEKMGAKELTALLNEYFTAMSEVVFLHKGTIDKFIGDAIMAFWGAPLEDPHHAKNAVDTALEMQEKLKSLELQKRTPIQIGIGIATGEMYVGDMGSRFRRSYTVIGDTVNLSSRLEGLTKFYSIKIIVSERTYLATKDRYLYRKLDKVRVKGKKQAVEIFEPLCLDEKASPALREEIGLHNQAQDAYAKGDWEKARQIWQQLKGDLYTMYLSRMQAPLPPPGWTGVQEHETK